MNKITRALIVTSMPRFGFTIARESGQFRVNREGETVALTLTEDDALDVIGARILPEIGS